MQLPERCTLARIYLGEGDRYDHRPLYEAVVLKAREMNMAGATVFRGAMGFGHSSRLHTAKILRLSIDLPIVVEIVDSEERMNEFLPSLRELIGDGLITLESIRVLHYEGSPRSD